MNLIITHENGDFDALAAAVAAEKLYPGSMVIMPEPLQPNVRSFINLYRNLLPLSDPRDVGDHFAEVVVVDTNRRERLGKWVDYIDRAAKVTVFDHHPGTEDLGADRSKIDSVGATTTILLEEIIKKKIPLTEFEVTLLALGIYEDTGCLTYDITTARDVRALSYLWDQGISTKVVQEYLRSPLTEVQKGLLEKLLHNSELYELKQRRVLISTTILDQYVVGAAVLLQLIDEIEDACITIVIIQMTASIYFAARTKGQDLDLLELLAPFDVKGYPGAVSAHFRGVEVEEVKQQVVEFLRYYLPPAGTVGSFASRPVFTVTTDTTIAEADKLLTLHDYTGCPVTEKGKLAGIISRRDLRKGLRNDLGHAPVKGFMSRKLITAGPDQSLQEMRRLMVEHDIGRIPVVDDDGKLVGIITRSDILRHLNALDRKGRSLKKKFPETVIIDEEEQHNISNLLNSGLPVKMYKLLLQIRNLADREKQKVFLVGGIIRDLLLKYPPGKDIDLVVIGDAVDFAYKLRKQLGGRIRHFEEFGTASIDLRSGLRLDFVTARKEIYASPAALPQVESSSLKNDLYRRDFTINTMACSLTSDNYGQFYDYYNGQVDLQKKIIRALYQLSFIDDPLRILRAIRFEQRYGFVIEPKTLTLIEKAIEHKVLEKVSRQRLNQELKQIYKEPSPVAILKRFDQLGLLRFLYPRLVVKEDRWAIVEEIEELIGWIEDKEWGKGSDIELFYLCGLLYDLESIDRSAIIRKLNLSRERATIIHTACREVPEIINRLKEKDLTPSFVVSALGLLPLEALVLAYALSNNQDIRYHIKLYLDGLRFVRPRLDGSDLKKLGLQPGPQYRKIFDRLKKAVLDGEVRTPQEELDYVITILESEQREDE